MNHKNSGLNGQGLAQPENQNQHIFATMIPVISGVIGSQPISIVNAKALHAALGVGRVFSSWFNSRVARYEFMKGRDFEQLTPERVEITGAGRPEINYAVSLDMAKELAMVENNEQGRAVRRYFIRCEQTLLLRAPEQAAQLRDELKARLTAASYFKPMCEALDAFRAGMGKTTQQHHYTTESNMLARIVLGGMTAKQWAQANGYTGNPRNHMELNQLEHLSYLEQVNTTLIEIGQDYHQRKNELLKLSQRWLAKRLEVSHAERHE